MSKTLALFQEEKLELVDIAVPLPVNDPFTYHIPPELVGRLQVGSRVRIPFKNRSLIGYAVARDSTREVHRPKKIVEVLDEAPVVSDHQLRLAKWMSHYYFSSWGEAISNMVPRYVSHKKKMCARPAPDLAAQTSARGKKVIRLTDEQTTAFKQLKDAIHHKTFSEHFLFGVTGGGKSELYIRAIKEILTRGESVICLVPEIALTEQLKHFFLSHFHQELEILHSKLTDRDRFDAWARIRKEEKHVILGARSAVFAPTPKLGLIIMDEEQEGSYKQDQTPRYHAREVARWRARDLSIPFLMGTATPTLESMHRVTKGEVQLQTLTKRIDGRPMPQVRIIDLKQVRETSKKTLIISPRLKDGIEKALQKKGGVLILLNRRGFSTHIRCESCQKLFYCAYCAVALTFHQEDQELTCHYCNFKMEVPDKCPKCEHALFKFFGVGTEKVESEVARLFPRARVGRLDADTTRKRGQHEKIISQFRNQELDILVGTQMIAKGFDFQHVTLVGVVNADTGLLLPDFRSSERTFQLLTQMAGRTGRGSEAGLVFVQTGSPHHYSIQFAAKHEYSGFFAEEIERRRAFRYPPFTKLINIVFRGKSELEVKNQIAEFGQLLIQAKPSEDVDVIGPAPLPLYLLRGHFRWHVMLRGPEIEPLGHMIREVLPKFRRKKGIFLAIDVDPISIL